MAHASPVLPVVHHILLLLCEFCSLLLCHTGTTSVHLLLSSPGYWYTYFCFLAGPSHIHTRIHSFSVFTKFIGPSCKYVFFPIPHISSLFLTLFLIALAFPFFLSVFLLLLSCTSQTSLISSHLLRVLLVYPSILSRLRYPTLFQPDLLEAGRRGAFSFFACLTPMVRPQQQSFDH